VCVSAVESVCAWEREKGKTNSVHGSWDLIYIISVYFFLLLNIFLFFFVILGIIYIYRERERESLASFMGTAFWGTLNAKQHVTLYRKQI
jgi:ABC-type multidrug transport system permease subunit